MTSGREAAAPAPEPPGPAGDVLDSWKHIAAYLERDVRTVMRWERARALPVHRLPGGTRAAVYALKSELEAWRASTSSGEPALGEQEGAAVPWHGRRLVWAAAAVTVLAAALLGGRLRSPVPPAGLPRPIRSLAVLPFDNLMKDPEQEYFVDGVHDALITELARMGMARVISRTSVIRYRGARRPARELAAELGVDALVEGSVLRVGDRVRISAQLVRGETDEHLWAGSYDRDVRDVLTLLADVSAAVAGEIRTAVAGAPTPAALPPSPAALRQVRSDAYEAYLRARYSSHTLTREGLESAVALHRRAIELDPDFAPAWSGLAGARAGQAFFGYVPAASVLPGAEEAARRALALDEDNGHALGALGFIALYWKWDFASAGRMLERALALSPASTLVRHQYADYLLVMGRTGESLEQTRIGRSYDPQWPTAHGIVVYHAIMARRYDEAVAEGRAMVHAFPDARGGRELLGTAFWHQGEHEAALAQWKAVRGGEDEGIRVLEAAYRTGGRSAALGARAKWLAGRADRGPQAGYDAAAWFAAASQRDAAFAWLERSRARREPFLLHVVADPFFDPIRSDPRFDALLRRIGIARGP